MKSLVQGILVLDMEDVVQFLVVLLHNYRHTTEHYQHQKSHKTLMQSEGGLESK